MKTLVCWKTLKQLYTRPRTSRNKSLWHYASGVLAEKTLCGKRIGLNPLFLAPDNAKKLEGEICSLCKKEIRCHGPQ